MNNNFKYPFLVNTIQKKIPLQNHGDRQNLISSFWKWSWGWYPYSISTIITPSKLSILQNWSKRGVARSKLKNNLPRTRSHWHDSISKFIFSSFSFVCHNIILFVRQIGPLCEPIIVAPLIMGNIIIWSLFTYWSFGLPLWKSLKLFDRSY